MLPLTVTLSIQRDDVDLEVEIEVADFYIRRRPRYFFRNFYADDDPNEVHFHSEALVKNTGEKIVLNEGEISQAEEKFWKARLC